MTLADYGIQVEPREGNQLIICPRCSHDRKKSSERCLSVDAVKGVWLCHHCNWKGKVEDQANADDRRLMLEFFKRRGISMQTVLAAGITAAAGWIKFPYTKRWREVNAKYRKIAEKQFKQTPGGERSLYGLDEVPVDTKRLVWVEGEIDALSLREVGIIAVSVPDGAPNPGSADGAKLQFLDSPEFEAFINAVPTHVIAVDEDAPGRTLRDALVSRLGFEKCEIVSWLDAAETGGKSAKDANEFLVKYGRDALVQRIAEAKPIPVSGVYTVRDLKEDMYRDYQHGQEQGLHCGIESLRHLWTIRPRELTIIHGYPNMGKSALMTRIAVNVAKQHGWKFAMFPAENLPLSRFANEIIEYYLETPITDKIGNKVPLARYYQGMSFVNDHFSFILPEEEATLDSILSRAQVQVRRWGANAIVIDPWTELYLPITRGENKSDAIERALRKVKKFIQTNVVHLFIVAHPHMPKDGRLDRPPNPSEINGSMMFFNKSDNILAPHRREGGMSDDVDIYSQKVRFRTVGQKGIAACTFDRWSGVYSSNADAGNRNGHGNRRFTRQGRPLEGGDS